MTSSDNTPSEPKKPKLKPARLTEAHKNPKITKGIRPSERDNQFLAKAGEKEDRAHKNPPPDKKSPKPKK